MKQYEKNIGKLMSIKKFGELNGKKISFCRLLQIENFDGMCYKLSLISQDGEELGQRWITRHMYQWHVVNENKNA